MCDRIAILDRGELVALDGQQELIASYTHQIGVFEGRLDGELPEAVECAIVSRSRNRTQIRIPRGPGQQALLQQLAAIGIGEQSLQLQEPPLEEVFLGLTGGDAS